MINRVWIDREEGVRFDPHQDNADVFVELEDGQVWAASFVTIPYLQRQMKLNRDVVNTLEANMVPVSFVGIETPHVIIEDLLPDTIEDTIDNLMTLGTFEIVFAQYNGDLTQALHS